MPHLVLSGLSKSYGPVVAVQDLALEVEKGESVALLGPSGCGKTTTLRMVAGLIEPTRGSIWAAGRDLTHVPAHRRNMGYVFQSYALFPHMNVAANVAFGLEERGVPRPERKRRVAEALALVRLDGLEERRPREISGGQMQRVALARALVLEPDVLLLDESLSNLDSKLRESMRHEIREIQRGLSITTLFVTHDQTEAMTMCDRVAVMDRGRIAQVGSPRDIYDRPASRFVADFVGRANVVPLARSATGELAAGGAPIRVSAADVSSAGEVDLFLRPQRLRLATVDEPASGANRLTGRVVRTAFVGDRLEVLLDTPAGRVTVELASGTPTPADGAEAAVLWLPADGHLFPRERAS
jgi:putative spermidine/putrescine transport system ATP-binding protein